MKLSPKNLVGDFVTAHPWIAALIGATALGAAGWTGAMLAQKVLGPGATPSPPPKT